MEQESPQIDQGFGAGDSVSAMHVPPYSFTPVPFQLDSYLSFMDIYKDGTCFLGASSLSGKYWTGSIWCFKEVNYAPDKGKALTGFGTEYGVTCGKFLQESMVIVGEDSGSVSIYSLQNITANSCHFVPQQSKFFHDQPVTSISVSSDLNKSVSSSKDSSIIIWENEGLNMIKKYSPAHGREVTCVAVEREQNEITFASTSLDGLCLLWDPRDSQPAFAVADDPLEPLTAVDWRNNNEIAVGSTLGNISIYDVRANAKLKEENISNRPIKKICFNRSNGLLAVCSDSKEVAVWDSQQQSIVYQDKRHSGFVRDVVWNPSMDRFHSCGFNKEIFSHTISNPPSCTNELNDLKIS